VRSLEISDESSVNWTNTALLTGLDEFYLRRPAFTSAVAVTVAPAQPSSPHGQANSAAIVSDSDCDSDLDYNPAAIESEVSSTDDDQEPSVDILFGARKSWADVDPKSRARAVRKLLPHMKETLLTQLHPQAGDMINCHRPSHVDQETAPIAEATVGGTSHAEQLRSQNCRRTRCRSRCDSQQQSHDGASPSARHRSQQATECWRTGQQSTQGTGTQFGACR
jgi:hypothetical protein